MGSLTSRSLSPTADNRERSQGADSALLNGVTTRRGTTATAQGVCTRTAMRAVPSKIADWTSRTLINPLQRRRAVEYRESPGSAGTAQPPPANLTPVQSHSRATLRPLKTSSSGENP
ncbi:hypothetical protein PC121_g22284 [Phytophthora cactorum]|nr:hypothetical protein PC120_g23869 [Phytophthora cactorum]KAG3043870.1 hypothetical protein PC121_g22284 [Phytophthora cactorum]